MDNVGARIVEGNTLWSILHMRNVPIHLDFKGRHLTGVADPIDRNVQDGIPTEHTIYINGKYIGTLSCEKQGWVLNHQADPDLVEALGEYLHAWYE